MPERFQRPPTLASVTHRVPTAHGTLWVSVSFSQDRPIEVFATIGKAGSCDTAYLASITRLASVALQYGVPLLEIVDQMRKVSCHPYMVGSDTENTSPTDAIGHILEEYVK